ncbi:Peptidyl-prolyl isomerase CWC27 [Debaryomyces fabryi]|uniref:Peptidyl-prolyl isomerase CWC27 n=1 Tax=Debaryomyces fabryi TaxID=58627 RepID=A0A0V1Q4C4_9ASCO|nr:Peptidyl-prolyl isomerase CWC27 [Debaryomyces fabryi]KSA03194.1 Peptidyl-prolyl isomerase CWC27 [Debaryomyces fabryi]CUM48472.1 unnamed protein product [Debaryomyces fabryi]
MSTLEPATTAKVVLITTKGPIEIEIWAKEVPNISRVFIQNCLDRKYIGTTFNKVIKDYLVQTSKIKEAEGLQLKDEFHSRLRFNKRGLVGAVHDDKRNSNNVDSIFITMKTTPEFNNNYVLFGKIMGDSIYNVVKINESELESEETPMYPAEITDIKVLVQYFDDLVESREQITEPAKKKAKKAKKPRVKLDYALEDEDDTGFKMKSAHDLLSDSKLSNKLYSNKKLTEVISENHIEKAAENNVEIKEIDSGHPNFEQTDKSDTLDNEMKVTSSDNMNDEIEHKRDEPLPKAKLNRNPNIDSDYDSDLDLSSSESIDLSAFKQS